MDWWRILWDVILYLYDLLPDTNKEIQKRNYAAEKELPLHKQFRHFPHRKSRMVFETSNSAISDSCKNKLTKNLRNWYNDFKAKGNINTIDVESLWIKFYDFYMSDQMMSHPSIKCTSKDMNEKKMPRKFDTYEIDDLIFEEEQHTMRSLCLDSSCVIEDPFEMATFANKFLTSVMNPKINRIPGFLGPKYYKKFTLTKEMVLDALNYIKSTALRSSGMLFMNAEMLKITADISSEILFELYKKSLYESKLPEDWLNTCITPAIKNIGDDTELIENYRPIGITCAPSKILEMIIADYLHKVMEKHINPRQHGGRKNHSQESQLVCAHEEMLLTAHKYGRVDCVRLDFSKAGDKVVHSILLNKLYYLGIDPEVLKWIRAFLNNRKQYVRVGNAFSNPENVTSGLPQGSPLSNVLLMIYLNSLPLALGVKLIYQFCDDTLIAQQITCFEDCELLQRRLDKLKSWTQINMMEINAKKCQVLSFSVKGRSNYYKGEFDYSIFGQKIEQTKSMKYLGVFVTDDFRSNDHLKYIMHDVKKEVVAGMDNLQKSKVRPAALENCYVEFLRSKLEMCSVVWGPPLLQKNKKVINKLEDIQKDALKHARRHKQMDLAARRLKNLILLISKIIEKQQPYIEIAKSLDIFDKNFNAVAFDVYFSQDESIVGNALKELVYLHEFNKKRGENYSNLDTFCRDRYNSFKNNSRDKRVNAREALVTFSQLMYPNRSETWLINQINKVYPYVIYECYSYYEPDEQKNSSVNRILIIAISVLVFVVYFFLNSCGGGTGKCSNQMHLPTDQHVLCSNLRQVYCVFNALANTAMNKFSAKF